MSFIEFRNVTKVYGEGAAAVRAADGIDLELERGEFVLVVAGAEEKAEEGCTFEAALDLVRARMEEGLSTKDAVKQVAKLTGFAKNLLYDAVVK